MVEEVKKGTFNNAINYRQALAINPPTDFHKLILQIKSIISYDKDMNFLFNSCGCGSWSNENAMKIAF